MDVTATRIVIVETKGQEDLDVPLKMQRLRQWCEDINRVQAAVHYDYLFVDEKGFKKYHPNTFRALVAGFREYIEFMNTFRIFAKKKKNEVRIARAFENYWVNHSLCKKLSSFQTQKELKHFILSEVNQFAKYGSKNYVQAVNESIRMINTH